MRVLILLGLYALVAQGKAASWWFGSSSEETTPALDETAIVSATEEVSDECLYKASLGHCAFYDCMERRFPCGVTGYNQKISRHFCNKITQNYNNFTTFGQLWLNRTSICLVGHMLPIYRDQTTTTCGAIKEAGIQGVVNCNAATVNGNNFCHFLNTNGNQYKRLMGTEEVNLLISLRDRRVFQSMISSTISCSLENFREFASSASQSFMRIMGNLWQSIWG